MAASRNLLTTDDPGMLGADDSRIPQDVREHYGDYDRTVATVVPVIGLTREEWWLFDTEGTLVDVLCRHA